MKSSILEDVRIVREALVTPATIQRRHAYRDADAALARLEARIAEAERERDEAVYQRQESERGWLATREISKRHAEAAEARMKELEGALRNVTHTADPGHARELATLALAADIPGPCDETPPLFTQGGKASIFYAGKKFDRDNQPGNDGLK